MRPVPTGTDRADLAKPVPDLVTELDGPVLAIDLSPEEDTLVVECLGELLLMDPDSLLVRRRWPADRNKVRRLEFSPDGTMLATAGYEGQVTLWDAVDGRQLHALAGHRGRVWSVTFSRDAAMIAAAGADHTVRLWPTDAAGSGPLAGPAVLHGHGAPIRSVAFSPDGTRIASGDEAHELRIWDVASGRLERCLPGHTGKVRCLRFRPDGTLVSGSSDGTVRSWDVATGAQLRLLQAHGAGRAGKIRTIAFSADHRIMVTGAQDHTARVWTGDGWRPLATLRGHRDVVTSAAVSVAGQRVFTSSADHTLRCWPLS